MVPCSYATLCATRLLSDVVFAVVGDVTAVVDAAPPADWNVVLGVQEPRLEFKLECVIAHTPSIIQSHTMRKMEASC